MSSATAARWAGLHADPRHHLKYPSEHVVRWLAGLELKDYHLGLALDIGYGSGRHLDLFRAFGYVSVVGIDAVRTDVEWTDRGDMRALPYADDYFDAALAYGVFYYGTAVDADNAVMEMHRILKPGGHAFVCVRSTRDWRYDHLDARGVFHSDGDPEDGMTMDFITEAELRDIYCIFSEVSYETSEWTTDGRDRLNSDWLISVTK